MNHKLDSRLPGEISITSDTDDTTLMAEKEKELKSLLLKMKEEIEKAGLKLNIQKTKAMASGPITSWQIDGETIEIVKNFILGGSKITADSSCGHEIKDACCLGKSYDQTRQHIKKQRHYLGFFILEVGYLFMAAPAKHIHCSLPWTWVISSWLLQQSAAAAPHLGQGVSPLGRPS